MSPRVMFLQNSPVTNPFQTTDTTCTHRLKKGDRHQVSGVHEVHPQNLDHRTPGGRVGIQNLYSPVTLQQKIAVDHVLNVNFYNTRVLI